ncbi:hypothetical protein ABT151_34805 [Streptomyces bluensis]
MHLSENPLVWALLMAKAGKITYVEAVGDQAITVCVDTRNGEVMRKYQRAAVVVAMLGSVGFLGAGVGQAHEGGFDLDSTQRQQCSADEVNVVGTLTTGAFAPVNTGGLQIIDQSDRHIVDCDQVSVFGK